MAQPASGARGRPLLACVVPKRRPVIMFIIIWLVLNPIFGLLGGGYARRTATGQYRLLSYLADFTGLFAIGLFERLPLSVSGGPGNAV